jgi:hypothetical protein
MTTTALILATHPFQMLLIAVSVGHALASLSQALRGPRRVRARLGIAPQAA